MSIRHLAAAALAAAVLAGPAHADDTTSTLTIQGNGVAFVTPDTADLSIGVRSAAHLRTAARSRANARTKAVIAALVAHGVKRTDIQTSGIQLSRTTRKHQPFYEAENDVSAHITQIGTLGATIDAVTHAGADSIDGPSFSFSDPSAGRADAARNALADARKRADDLAAAAGEKVTGVRSIVVDPQSIAYDDSSGSAAAPASATTQRKTATQVSPGRQEVDATVQVVYTLAPA